VESAECVGLSVGGMGVSFVLVGYFRAFWGDCMARGRWWCFGPSSSAF
jgi:hypothetical protein